MVKGQFKDVIVLGGFFSMASYQVGFISLESHRLFLAEKRNKHHQNEVLFLLLPRDAIASNANGCRCPRQMNSDVLCAIKQLLAAIFMPDSGAEYFIKHAQHLVASHAPLYLYLIPLGPNNHQEQTVVKF